MRFVDTNVLLYAASTAPEERSKSSVALSILEADDLALSVQVLQEFYVQATRSGKQDKLTHEQATLLIESFLRFPVQETTVTLLQGVLDAKHRYRVSYWDAAIIEAARALGCHTILSEDLNHGQDYDGVKVIDPFRKRRRRVAGR
jgi:predicted nucleic acid-binding protein